MDKSNHDEWPIRVKKVIIEVLGLGTAPSELADDLPLYSSELQLDSLTLLHLLVSFEKEFGIEIDDEDVMNANLDSVRSLIDLVMRVTGPGLGV